MNILVKNIYYSYGEHNILKDVSLMCKSGQFVGIIGPNGSGKSTLLKCIYRVLKPDHGFIYLDEKMLWDMSYKESAKCIAVMAQQNNFNFEFTVEEIVLMGRSPHKKTMERDHANDYKIAEEALKKVGMFEFSKRSFSTLSGGEQQRIILARALAQKTECLILDEPTNHLDITHQLQLLKLMKELNLTIIAAIHDLNIAAAFCDYIYVMNQGTIVKEGKTEEILTPQLVKQIYHVDAETVRDRNNQMHILFLEALHASDKNHQND